jgi:hypothetical protein
MQNRLCSRASSRHGQWVLASCWILAHALTPDLAFAQFSMLGDQSPHYEWGGHIESDYRTEFKTKTKGGDSFESWGVGLAGAYGGPINESMLVGVRARYHYASYNFRLDNAPGVPSVYGSSELPRDPWGPINTIDLAPNLTLLVGDQFSVIAAVPIRWSAETGATENGLVAGISAIARWHVTEKFRIGAGIGVTSQLEEDPETFPLVSLDWQVTNNLQLITEGSWIQGGQATLLWGPNPAIRLTLSGGYERNRFRLDHHGFSTDRDGIGEVTSIPVDVGVRIRLYEGAFLDFRAGIGFGGRLRVEDAAGDRLYDERYDPAPRIGIGLTLAFGLPAQQTDVGEDDPSAAQW